MIRLATGRKADPAEYLLGALTRTQLNLMFSHYNRHWDQLKEGLASSWSLFMGQLLPSRFEEAGGWPAFTRGGCRSQRHELRAAGGHADNGRPKITR